MKRTYDVVALIAGVVFIVVALGALWLALVGPLPWERDQDRRAPRPGRPRRRRPGPVPQPFRRPETKKGSPMTSPIPPQPPKRLVRSTSNRMIGGVCGGVADYLNMDATLVRILTVVISLFTGVPVILYIIALFVVPEGNTAPTAPPPVTGASTYSGPFSGAAGRDPAAGVRALPGHGGRARRGRRGGRRLGQRGRTVGAAAARGHGTAAAPLPQPGPAGRQPGASRAVGARRLRWSRRRTTSPSRA